MRQYRFFVTPQQIDGRRLSLKGGQARQIYSVLRMREEAQITALDDRGWQYEVRLDKVTSDLVTGDIVSRTVATGEPQTRLTLYQAMLKKDNFEWVLQKGTELGVARFVPLITRHSVVRHETLKQAKSQRWQRIITEAAEQSGRGHLPVLAQPVTLPEALDATSEYDRAFIPWENEIETSLVDALGTISGMQRPAAARVAIFVGPEGGFAEEEIVEARTAGVHPVTLGPRILRAETAAIVAAALVLSTLGDLN